MRGAWFVCGGDRIRPGWHEQHVYHWYALPGVYAIYEGEKLLYIGQSRNVERRLLRHGAIAAIVWARSKVGLSTGPLRVKIRYTDPEDAKAREARLIRRLSPPYNTREERIR